MKFGRNFAIIFRKSSKWKIFANCFLEFPTSKERFLIQLMNSFASLVITYVITYVAYITTPQTSPPPNTPFQNAASVVSPRTNKNSFYKILNSYWYSDKILPQRPGSCPHRDRRTVSGLKIHFSRNRVHGCGAYALRIRYIHLRPLDGPSKLSVVPLSISLLTVRNTKFKCISLFKRCVISLYSPSFKIS